MTLPHGTKLLCTYSGQRISGEIIDGRWSVEGNSYNSPTTAAVRNVFTKEGTPTNLNGWKIWKVKRPQDREYLPIMQLRREASKT